MTYTISRDVPIPTIAQLGREPKCCPECQSEQLVQTTILPPGIEDGIEQLVELAVGDALDGPWEKRNKLGLAAKSYDKLNKVKHEIYQLDDATVRCRRMK